VQTIRPSQSTLTGAKIIRRPFLSISFAPGPFDIICAQGKAGKNHLGNVRFRKQVNEYVEPYGSTTVRAVKTNLLSNIVEAIRSRSDEGSVRCFQHHHHVAISSHTDISVETENKPLVTQQQTIILTFYNSNKRLESW
jgi:hypothetical protein